jgi:RNA polymerase sigma factor (sigma-70 family)
VQSHRYHAKPIRDEHEFEVLHRRLEEVSAPKYDPLSPEEERELGRQMLDGDESARLSLFNACRRWSIAVARRFSGYADLDDLVQACDIGLWRALDSWQPDGGARLATWAFVPMRQEVRRTIRAHELIKAPLRDRKRLSRVTPVDLELFSGVLPDAESRTHESVEARDSAQVIRLAISTLPNATDADVITLLFGLSGEEPLSMAEIGVRLGVSRQRIKQRAERAMRELREGPMAAALLGLLEE